MGKRKTNFGIYGAPDVDLRRSGVAAAVGRLAAKADLLMAHYEHRVQLPTPDDWNPHDRPDLEGASGWDMGVLPEGKYASFRHDQLIGSFHPMHRGKWTAHELCHGLVGFAWKPQASGFFHAMAARLAEILPVALWYFFDEAGLNRCPLHAGQGPLFRKYCIDCERAAWEGPVEDPLAERWFEDGRAFVQGEIEAVHRSIKTGRPVPYRYATLDLASDAMAYAAAHGARLNSPQFHDYIARFFPEGGACHRSLEALEQRVLDVMAACLEGKKLKPLGNDRWHWIVQDVAWRLYTIHADANDDLKAELMTLIEALTEQPNQMGVKTVIAGYEILCRDLEMPLAEDVFSVGYPLVAGYGSSRKQVCEGIISACPSTAQVLSWRGDDLPGSFLSDDKEIRKPIGVRFRDFLSAQGETSLATLASFDAALAYAPTPDASEVSIAGQPGPEQRVQLAAGIKLVKGTYNFVELANYLRQGHPGQPRDSACTVAVGRRADGDVFIAELPESIAWALEALEQQPMTRAETGLQDGDLEALESCGVVVPAA